MKPYLLLALVTLISLSACSKKEETAAPGGAPALAAGSPANSGKIAQLQHAGTYTYAEVELGNGQRVWMAGGHVEVKVGDMIQWGGNPAEMRNFNAKSLNRVFDRILFVDNWGLAGAAPVAVVPHGVPGGASGGMPAGGHPPMAGSPAAASTWVPANAPPAGGGGNSGQVKSVANAGGYSYLEVAQGNTVIWIAAPETRVAVGNTVRWEGGSVMRNFTAKSLNRTFDSIVFTSGVAVVN